MPKLSDGDNGKKNTNAIGIGSLFLLFSAVRNIPLQHNVAEKWMVTTHPPSPPPAPECLE